MSILIKDIPLGGYEISIMKDGERYRARVDGIWCEVEEIPTTEPDTDTISRAKAIDLWEKYHPTIAVDAMQYDAELRQLPSAQPERRCVNCGRTVNNGGWYEDGRTRCPIEEHYALPKDGYCHLWEKRKDWEDDYVKRAEEGEK